MTQRSNKKELDKASLTAIISAIVGVVVGLLIGVSLPKSHVATVVDSKPTQATPKNKEAFATKSFTGNGASAENRIQLQPGVYVVESTHSGSSNYEVKFIDKDTGNEELLVNEIGNYSGSTTLTVSQQTDYILSIEADGAWSVKISQ